jgi:hypothetical protein
VINCTRVECVVMFLVPRHLQCDNYLKDVAFSNLHFPFASKVAKQSLFSLLHWREGVGDPAASLLIDLLDFETFDFVLFVVDAPLLSERGEF